MRSIRDRSLGLDRVYGLYETFSKALNVACHPGCFSCCTQDVTATTLEGLRIIQALEATHLEIPSPMGFQPVMTTNSLARICASGQEPPEEDHPVSSETCPFLNRNLCSIYPFRPFGCRCFVSARPCGEEGFADLDPLILTVNTVFLQVIEHLDRPGFYGNFLGVLGFLKKEDNRRGYEDNRLPKEPPALLVNHPVPAFMVPPEHRKALEPWMAKLRELL